MSEPEIALPGPEIVIIAAVAEENRVIGRGMNLPWHIPDDLKRFQRLTMGHPLIMGRRTFESLMHQFGGEGDELPLAGRELVVLTRSPENLDARAKRARIFGSLDDALEAYRDKRTVFVGGGAAVYEAALERAHRLELTIVEGSHDGDVFFPPYRHLLAQEDGPFRLVALDHRDSHDGRPGFRYETYQRE